MKAQSQSQSTLLNQAQRTEGHFKLNSLSARIAEGEKVPESELLDALKLWRQIRESELALSNSPSKSTSRATSHPSPSQASVDALVSSILSPVKSSPPSSEKGPSPTPPSSEGEK